MKRYTYSRKDGVDWEALLYYMGNAVACKVIDPFPETHEKKPVESEGDELWRWRQQTNTNVETVAGMLGISVASVKGFEANNPIVCGNVYLKLVAFVLTLNDSGKYALERKLFKLWREENLYTHDEIANIIGVHKNTIIGFENTVRKSDKILQFIADDFKMPSAIRILRMKKKITPVELSELIDVSRGHIISIEVGRKKLTGKTKEKYIAFFGKEAVTDAIERTEAESRVER